MNNDSLVLSALKKVVPIHLQRVNFFSRKRSQNQINPVTTMTQATPAQTVTKADYRTVKVELSQAVQESKDILAQASTALTLFRDTVVVNRAKVSITRRSFFSVSEIISIPIEDVLSVTVTTGPFLGTIKIVSRILNLDAIEVGKFWRQDALRLKTIIQGYLIALQQGIDCNTIPTNELITTLERLGSDRQ